MTSVNLVYTRLSYISYICPRFHIKRKFAPFFRTLGMYSIKKWQFFLFVVVSSINTVRLASTKLSPIGKFQPYSNAKVRFRRTFGMLIYGERKVVRYFFLARRSRGLEISTCKCFKDYKLHLPYGLVEFCCRKIYSRLLHQIALEIMLLTKLHSTQCSYIVCIFTYLYSWANIGG